MTNDNYSDRFEREVRRTENIAVLALGAALWLAQNGHLAELDAVVRSEELCTLGAHRLQELVYMMFATKGASVEGRNIVEVAAAELIRLAHERRPS